MIKLTDINVTFKGDKREIRACENVNLNIEKKDIYGIVGYSGAGKSTLVRCINLLQRPDSGTVIVDGDDLTKKDDKGLRIARKEIGMIFQNFNLLDSRTVFENVYYPIRKSKEDKKEKRKRVLELLKLVGIEDKQNAYPRQLSGGQKQRVAIARALATNPKILLCDEATSALDPKTTLSILKLLKGLNEKLDLTIVIITHEMQVVKEICNKCAVMEDGKVIEDGLVIDIFTRPNKTLTREFINTALHNEDTIIKLKQNLTQDQPIYTLKFVGSNTHDSFTLEIYKRFGVETNILSGNIEYISDTPLGNLIVTLKGEQNNIDQAIEFLEKNNIEVEVA